MKSTPATRLLVRPVAEWQRAINSTRADLQNVESELAAIIQRATLLHSYISHRYNTGCGDQGREASAKVANRALVKVRKALGYSMPAQTPLSIR